MEALDITKGTAGNAIVEDILEQTKIAIQAGEPVFTTIQAHPQVFPPMVSSMIAIGEETGALDTMLQKSRTSTSARWTKLSARSQQPSSP